MKSVFIFSILQKGKTALHLACDDNQEEMVELLLKQGASINIQDKVIKRYG